MRNSIYKTKDPVLRLVLSEIHKTAQKPDKGFLTVEQWSKKWGYPRRHAAKLITKALKTKIIIQKKFRILNKNRITLINHYGLNK